MGLEFKPLSEPEKKELLKALKGNAERNEPIFMDPKTTEFRPKNRVEGMFGNCVIDPDSPVTDEETINAIKSIPCHY